MGFLQDTQHFSEFFIDNLLIKNLINQIQTTSINQPNTLLGIPAQLLIWQKPSTFRHIDMVKKACCSKFKLSIRIEIG